MKTIKGGFNKGDDPEYEYDILNIYENISMDLQFFLSIGLLFLIVTNFINIKKWCQEKKVKPYKLYCINSTSLLTIICFFFELTLILFLIILARLISQSDTIYFHIHQENYNLVLYLLCEFLDAYFLNMLLMIVSINW